jgi:hypothetical protein
MKRLVLLFVALLGLTACGGGGGGGTTATPTPAGTMVNLAQFKGVFLGTLAGAQYSFPALFGTDLQGRAWSGSFAIIADGATMFEGQNVTKSRSLVSLQLAGGTPVSSTTTSYFQVSDGSPYKSISSTGVTYTPTSQGILPTTAKVGQLGDLGTSSGTDGTTTTSSWELFPDINGASILILFSTVKTGSTVTATEEDHYYLDAAGTPTKLFISVTTSGVTVNLSGNKL